MLLIVPLELRADLKKIQAASPGWSQHRVYLHLLEMAAVRALAEIAAEGENETGPGPDETPANDPDEAGPRDGEDPFNS